MTASRWKLIMSHAETNGNRPRRRREFDRIQRGDWLEVVSFALFWSKYRPLVQSHSPIRCQYAPRYVDRIAYSEH
jgi:hypothetical protein